MREWENKTMNNEVEIETMDKQTREAKRIGERKYLSRDVWNLIKTFFRN